MILEQQLTSGIYIRQDTEALVRFVFFETGFEGWEYATHGGTAFVINFQNTFYALTCNHVFGDFDTNRLVITNRKFGDRAAGYNAIFRPTAPMRAAVDTDITDIALIRFSPDCQADFFEGTAYTVEMTTIASASRNDHLLIEGTLKEPSAINDTEISPIYCSLRMNDAGIHTQDITLRKANGQFDPGIGFTSVTGLSGSPVFNLTKNVLSGMVVRGGMNENYWCDIFYIDIQDIYQLLCGAHDGRATAIYERSHNF